MIKNYLLLLAFAFISSVNAQIINIPDANFKAKLLNADISNGTAEDRNGKNIRIDTNRNGEIEISEALTVYKLFMNSSGIKSLEGISNFANITELYCSFNQLTTLDVSALTELDDFNCADNNIITLNVNGLTKLTKLACSSNKIEFLNLSASKDLIDLDTSVNPISSLNIKGLTKLESLLIRGNIFAKGGILDLSEFVNLRDIDCRSLNITGLKIQNSPKIEWLNCSSNRLTSLDVSNLTKLKTFNCSFNKLTTLNVSNSTNLSTLDCSSNSLESLFIKVGRKITNLNFASNYDLNFICTDENQIEIVSSMPLTRGFYCKNVNSYCSFTPGGTYYTISGKSKFDLNSNGCDEQDIAVPNIKFNIVNGIDKSVFVADQSGKYNLPVGGGTYSISPKLENLNYFKVSPESITVSFPAETSPSIQNFCFTSNGIHKDLEISLLPIEAARPGFDVSYKIIYTNKGNVTQSGNVSLTYNDAVLDIVSSNPVVSSQYPNNFNWNFTNLAPFETREIVIILNVNSPMEVPAVNNVDILSYTATINSANIDETPNNNTFTLNQKVVGSYDPNDKTCLDGDIIKPELIGEYVYYIIRFENTGTYSVQNVVVKDIIDLTKFDISTLTPTSASHSYITKISNKNKVEFIFENILLSFDDANNDGYIAFKIKTLPTLKVGDSFQNEANIYFDYNFPILTNKATSTFNTTLETQDFEFSNYLNVYPVPAKEFLNVSVKNNIEINSMAIYNLLGQLVIAVPNAQNTKMIDVTQLKTGTYFLTIKSDKGTSNTKFIKE